MTVLESFLQFAKDLPSGQLHDVEAVLAEIMASYSSEHEFTEAELSALRHRLAEADPDFATDKDVKALFGKSF